ncbi:protein CWC15 homolog [Panicum virgatum]|nr:protein CWC15 homolog [Panicum virgatum]
MFITGPSHKYSSCDLAAHTSLKPREGQQTQEELQKRNLREELEERERKHYSSKDKSYAEERDRRKSSSQLLLEGSKRDAEDKIVPREIDADDSDVEPKSDGESDEDDDDDDDDDDDTEALMAELERIKKERAEEKLRKERQQAEEEAKMKEAELMRGNPLININNPGSFSVKRRWDDDVVFKNQASGETKTPKRFINDTIRSDFHRKFLQRYMK